MLDVINPCGNANRNHREGYMGYMAESPSLFI